MAARLREGEGRADALFKYLGPQARHCDSEQQLLDVARNYADDHFEDPLNDSEIRKTVHSVWKYENSGLNFIGKESAGQRLMIPGEMVSLLADNYGLKTLGLYVWAKGRFGGMDNFTLPNGLAKNETIKNISRRDIPACRLALIEAGLIIRVRAASSAHGPELFRWAK